MQWNAEQKDGPDHPAKAMGTVVKVSVRAESMQMEWPITWFPLLPPGWASTEHGCEITIRFI